MSRPLFQFPPDSGWPEVSRSRRQPHLVGGDAPALGRARGRTYHGGTEGSVVMKPRGNVTNRLEIVRGLYGLCQLVAPRLLAESVIKVSVGPVEATVIRVLGGRHLLQAVLTLRTRHSGVHRLGGVVDLLHALSMVGVGVASHSNRRAALADAAVASTFAVLEFQE